MAVHQSTSECKMFKVCLVLVAILGLSAGGAVPAVPRSEPGALDLVLAEFLALSDTDEIALILLSYLFDPEFQVAMQFIFSPTFSELYLEIAEDPGTKEFIVFLEENGLTVDPILSAVRAFLLLPPRSITPGLDRTVVPRQARAGIAGLLEELQAVTPGDEFVALADYHVENTPEFAALLERMQSPPFAAAMRDLQDNPTVDLMGLWLKAVGVDVNLIIDNINEELGWGLRPL